MADKKYRWVKTSWLVALLGMGVAGFYLFSHGSAHSVEKAAVAQEHVSVPKRAVPLSSVKHSLYLVLRQPSAEFIAYLGQLAAQGIAVRMVTTVNLPSGTGLTVGTVRPDQISADGVLIDGTSWYDIGADSRFE
jgi:hypothetical protein